MALRDMGQLVVVDLTVLGLWLDWTIFQLFSSKGDSMNFTIFAPVVSVYAVFQTTSALGARNLKSILVSLVGQWFSNPMNKWQSTGSSPNRGESSLGLELFPELCSGIALVGLFISLTRKHSSICTLPVLEPTIQTPTILWYTGCVIFQKGPIVWRPCCFSSSLEFPEILKV